MATWNELAARIMKMPEAERKKEAIVREPYDDAPEMYPVAVFKATEDLLNSEGDVVVKKGEYLLQ